MTVMLTPEAVETIRLLAGEPGADGLRISSAEDRWRGKGPHKLLHAATDSGQVRFELFEQTGHDPGE